MSIEKYDDRNGGKVNARTLTEIEQDLAEKQTELGRQWTRTLDVAVGVGEVLIEAKQQVPRGHWLTWLSDHFDGSERTAQRLMRVAANPTEMSGGLSARGSMTEALAALTEPKPTAADLDQAWRDLERLRVVALDIGGEYPAIPRDVVVAACDAMKTLDADLQEQR